MNVNVNRENLSPFGAVIVKGSRLILTDQNTMGKPLGVAEGSAKALAKTTAFSIPESTEQETMVMSKQATTLEGAVPVYANATEPTYGELESPKVETVDTVGGIILDSNPTPDLAARPTVTYGDNLPDGYVSVASAQAAESNVGVANDDKSELSSRDILLGNTGAIQQEPLNEGEGTIVLEDPANGGTTTIPEPEREDTVVKIDGNQFNVATSTPEDENKDNNPNLNPSVPEDGLVLPSYTDVKEDGKKEDNNLNIYPSVPEGLVTDLPPVEQMDKTIELSSNELNQTQKPVEQIDKFVESFAKKTESANISKEKAIIEFKESIIKKIDEFIESLGDINSYGSERQGKIEDVLSSVDNAVIEGVSKIDGAIKNFTAYPTYGQVTDVPQQEVLPTTLGI